MSPPLVAMENVTVRFKGAQTVHAVNGVSLTLEPGKVLGILGESGSGKSVTLKTLLRLLPENRTDIGGKVMVDGKDVLALGPQELADYRGAVTSMIFQDPALALDPVYTVGEQIAEAIRRHEKLSAKQAMARALELLELVRIPSPERRLKAYPHEMSGGMRQRAMIALALAARPKLLLADEPTTALDATVQIQILLLLRQLQRDLGMGVIFVTHDIGVAVEVSDRLAVMYAGQIVETGTVRELLRDPRHPYTRGLLAANLHGAKKGERLEAIPGAPPPLNEAPSSCSFAPRCKQAEDACRTGLPPAVALGEGRLVRCTRVEAALAPA
ncbi:MULTISPECIES: ABC transporter ATP-binding protein [unclassified Bosea (in: a-proteobacteria)]|uniref:ABC transporter ATP-binding protein n=1 Tax=unclassified Bosea (in: a-proteobacteria) TaxID=2653178 RepID=UPI000F75C045|nr:MULTISPECIES: ABC transporter ATP-binding protein [unclassified Bosea (in: a-proteobacteria)]AZO79957.1 dipeptide ABC transporter ATP-binding protein DppD [Bosea sp. Tri-49]RXT22734.1 dipeptide ABC transporter ATP-binding protein DppD [Bosea sp. Tri-39]RXT38203.1 dipeptide ABC transporter ATP-binding protein DppD [Bosea sp. Tri-54]